MENRVRIGITMGDPAGIGPELVVRALSEWPETTVFGDRRTLERSAETIGVSLPSTLSLVEVTQLAVVRPGVPSEATGRAQVAYLEAALREVKAGRVEALVTAPIHKASARAAGFAFPGHTEFLADRLGVDHVTMMLAGPRLRVSLVTTHVSLAEVPRRLTSGDIERAIIHTAQALRRDFGVAVPKIAVAALNPHAGEQGHFGDEEARVIAPAIERARARCPEAELSGPHVPDAIFRMASAGEYHAVVAMYHDQGLIPVKLLNLDEAVNLTLGLPIVRTSPDHGVAYDLAGTGRARPDSFLAALRLAAQLAARRGGTSRPPSVV
jgi:4-hydroxythreonine-4-phosphate dehydrogenase